MIRLNLGCGSDVKHGYVNVDFRSLSPGIVEADLSSFPWQWKDESVDEVLMYDFLEHFPYHTTKPMLEEVWRILKVGAAVEIQVPDFEQCARAILKLPPYICNRCEKEVTSPISRSGRCSSCGVDLRDVADAGVWRLYGGQDYVGNFHQTTFTPELLERVLTAVGFMNFEYLEEDHQKRNWNFKVRAIKVDPWGEP
jgi:hypothetical protein